MPYLPNIPQAAQRINDTQPLIQTNFTLLNTYFGNNHVTFNAAGDWGKHTVVQFLRQGAEPAAVPGSTDKLLYSLLYGAQSEIFVKNGTDVNGIPMTARGVAGTEGWTYLPSGLLIKYGRYLSQNGVAHNFIGPAFTDNPPYLIATPYQIGLNAYAINIDGLTNNNVTLQTWRLNPGVPVQVDCQVNYIAIGR